MTVEIIYEMQYHDFPAFQGWIIWKSCNGHKSVYFKDTDKEAVQAIWNDLRNRILRA